MFGPICRSACPFFCLVGCVDVAYAHGKKKPKPQKNLVCQLRSRVRVGATQRQRRTCRSDASALPNAGGCARACVFEFPQASSSPRPAPACLRARDGARLRLRPVEAHRSTQAHRHLTQRYLVLGQHRGHKRLAVHAARHGALGGLPLRGELRLLQGEHVLRATAGTRNERVAINSTYGARRRAYMPYPPPPVSATATAHPLSSRPAKKGIPL